MKHRLHELMEENDLFSNAQGGGKRRRCIDKEAMITRVSYETSKHKKEEAIITFLDAKAAFDRVDHFIFLVALCVLGVNRNFINLTQNWLKNAKSCLDSL